MGAVRGLRSVVAERGRRVEYGVSFGRAMGLLDDAIREHMELKRLRGADPGEVARQERDALGPVVLEHDADEHGLEDGEDGHEGHDEIVSHDGALGANGDEQGPEDDHTGHEENARGPDFANVSQETAELDMRTVLEEELVEDGLEEGPSIPGETPGQERLSFE
jgi:hypothetical protein